MTIYNLRVIERLWGSRKFASFLALTYLPTTLLAPLLLLALRPLTLNALNLLPAGPTPIIFALLAQYHAAIPTVYKYRVITSLSSSQSQDASGLVFSDKTTTYLLAGQLALSSLPGSALAAGVGWLSGTAWRGEWGPAIWGQWRVPAWVVGESTKAGREGFDGLRRRLEGEGRASGTGAAAGEGQGAN
ncbi:uncharacterized protein KY384_004317 [Bacidia gigantensis]|uniref:uncharacterized protein n=1 Tax=Bacidia gigantensis TaxID=2732470 RepID=UPI001D05AA4C|nr:uncharacterized protein KY384_004317 [Bacidia gigantensis]KAG8530960.1 hypothetical protein KY384_004317 [Bacidia gigantensis]